MSVDLAALVASPHWRWVVGMRDLSSGYVFTGHSGDVGWWADKGDAADTSWGDERPDLDDPATRGCLLSLVREAWGDRIACVCVFEGNLWGVVVGVDENDFASSDCATEAEALCAALLAAPAKDGGS